MGDCTTTEILKLGGVRSYIQVPDPRSCGRKTLYYGKDCQKMEVDGVTRNIRNAGTPIRTWNRRRGSYCTIGTTETPPDNPQVSLRFYEDCLRGLPLPHTLGACRIRVINNYGLCNSSGKMVNSWSSYAEVLDLNILTENRGRRSSYDGTDEALTDEITAELLNLYDVSTVQFSQVNMTNLACAVGGGGVFNDAAFGCANGCGNRNCGCKQSCDDGTYSIYIAASCTGGTTQFVVYSTDGGENSTASVLPAASGGAASTTFPKVAVIGSTLYVLAYQNPPALYSIALDSHGNPEGSWQLEAILNKTATGTTVSTGIPGRLVVDGDNLHILVFDATAGSRFYTLGGTRNPNEGARVVFETAQNIADMAACGGSLVAVGDDASIQYSGDDGSTWRQLTAPDSFTADITAVDLVDGRVWIGAASGAIHYSLDEGDNWTNLLVSGITGTVNDIKFAGDDIGWIADTSGRPASTWVGGLNNDEWTRETHRVFGFPAGVTPVKNVVPMCASAVLSANVVLVLGTDAGGDSVAYIGRAPVTGI